MKNTLKAFIAAAIITLIVICNAHAQATPGNSSINGETGSSTPVIDNSKEGNDVPNTINKRALKDFQKAFNGITNVTWSKTNDRGYIAQFSDNDVQTVVAYNPKGIWQYTMLRYSEQELPRSVRNIVKGRYYDYTIGNIAEIHLKDESFNDRTVYMIYMQNETDVKAVTVCDGEMQEVKN